MRKTIVGVGLLCCSLFVVSQDQAPRSVVNININVSRSVPAVNYQTNSSTRIDFKGTPLQNRRVEITVSGEAIGAGMANSPAAAGVVLHD
jgi:hypothetical protein